MTTLDLHHWELADQLVKAAVDGDEQTYFDTLFEVVEGGLRTAVNVIRVLVPMHNPEAPIALRSK